MAVNERLRTLTEFMQEKENFPTEDSSLTTPGRKPLRTVQENLVGTSELSRSSLKRRVNSTRSSFTPNGLNSNKVKRKSKRLSIPVHVFRRALKQNQKPSPPMRFSSDLTRPNVLEKKITNVEESAVTVLSCTVVEESCQVKNATAVPVKIRDEKLKEEETQIDLFAEGLVNQVFINIAKENQDKQQTQIKEYQDKIQEFTQIILQMNKERLQQDKQLAVCKKEHVGFAMPAHINEMSSQKHKSTNITKTEIKQDLSKKTLEIQRLKKELQQAQGSKMSFESKKEETRQLKVEINQLQHQLREVPGLKTELQKSRQQVTHLNEAILASRRENNSQKSLLAKLEKELSSKEARAKQYIKDCERNIVKLKADLCEKDKVIHELNEVVVESDKEKRLYKQEWESLSALVGRLEVVSEKAEKFKVFAEQKVVGLTMSLSEKSVLCQSLEEQLQTSRCESLNYRQECAALKTHIGDLKHEVDLGHLEISRQEGAIISLSEQIEKLTMENALYQEHLELIQCQHQEMNTFLTEEKQTIEETAREMEKELESTKQKGLKVDELKEEVKLSRSMFMDKQEELDATQSHAHFMICELQSEITDAQEALDELWNVVGPLLNKFRQQAQLENQEEEEIQEQREPSTAQPPASLVQSVLSAVAQATNPEESSPHSTDENDYEIPVITLCNQIHEIKQGLLELADIGHGQPASIQAQQRIAQLENDRESLKKQYTTMVEQLKSDLSTCRSNESNMAYTIQRQTTEIENLGSQLSTTRENLQQTNKEYDSMADLLEVEIEQRQKISALSDQLQRKEQELRRMESEKECLLEQLTEATKRMNEMSNDVNHAPGKLLEEKFMAERKLKQVKDKWMEYRLKADDSFNEHKLVSSRKIITLEKRLQQTENEICHLDEVLEKIRLILHSNLSLISQCPSLAKVLRFLDGDQTEQ